MFCISDLLGFFKIQVQYLLSCYVSWKMRRWLCCQIFKTKMLWSNFLIWNTGYLEVVQAIITSIYFHVCNTNLCVLVFVQHCFYMIHILNRHDHFLNILYLLWWCLDSNYKEFIKHNCYIYMITLLKTLASNISL